MKNLILKKKREMEFTEALVNVLKKYGDGSSVDYFYGIHFYGANVILDTNKKQSEYYRIVIVKHNEQGIADSI